MQRPLREHINYLEEKIVILKRELRNTDLADYQRSEQELQLKNAEEALSLFRRAYELERKIGVVSHRDVHGFDAATML